MQEPEAIIEWNRIPLMVCGFEEASKSDLHFQSGMLSSLAMIYILVLNLCNTFKNLGNRY